MKNQPISMLSASGLFALVLSLPGCHAHRAPASSGSPTGPRTTSMELFRSKPDGVKLYVMADLGDGEPRVFMVDTGASVSVLTVEVAKSLGLKPELRGPKLVGLGGSTPWYQANVPKVELGPYSFHNVPFAVGVPGVPTRAGLVPIAGILGNNIWQHFGLAIDYPANTLELALGGGIDLPAHAQPMFFNGQHASTLVELRAERDGQFRTQRLEVEIDTGAVELVLNGPGPAGLEAVSTEGIDAVLGVGADQSLPTSSFLRTTRRVAVQSIAAGGVVIEEPLSATWVNFNPNAAQFGPAQLGGLLGHRALDGYRVTMDYPRQRFALSPSTARPQSGDLHQWALDRSKRPKTAAELTTRVHLLAWTEQLDEAQRILVDWRASHDADPSLDILLARILRHRGDPDAALALIEPINVGDLIVQGELIALVNGLWLAGRADDAMRRAQEATSMMPGELDSWLALSDAARATGDLETARRALREANRIEENPDGHLLRRAWVASAEGDTHAFLTHMQRLINLYPAGGIAPWFYSRSAASADATALLGADVRRARGRLHPGDGPLDFHAASLIVAGDPDGAHALMDEGLQRDCAQPGVDAPSRQNCQAWYAALGGGDLAAAQRDIDAALAASPDRTEFLDTQAVVHEANHKLDDARESAWRAAQMAPDDVYLCWQAARLDHDARAAHP